MIRLTAAQIGDARSNVSDYTKQYLDNPYPCGDGGWIHYRVTTQQQLQDAELMLSLKCR